MPERVHVLDEEPQEEPARKPAAEGNPRRLLVRIGGAIIAAAVLVWLIEFLVGQGSITGAAGAAYAALQHPGPATPGVQPEVRTFGAALTYRQVRSMVGGRSLKFEWLTPHQQELFNAVHPLGTRPAPPLVPYEVRIASLRGGERELRLVWQVAGRGEAVGAGLRL